MDEPLNLNVAPYLCTRLLNIFIVRNKDWTLGISKKRISGKNEMNKNTKLFSHNSNKIN